MSNGQVTRNTMAWDETSERCPLCDGLGYTVRRSETGELVSRTCRCEIVRQNRRRIRRSGLAGLLERCTFASFETPEAWQQAAKRAAEEYLTDCRGKWFFIGGSSGTGKTHLCTAICGQLMAGGIPCRYVQWRGDIPAIKAKIKDAEAYHEEIWPLKTVRALYIDDFLKGSVTEADKNIAFDLLNARYNDPKAITILSTEWPIDKILSWDEAIGSRIAERAREYTLNLRSKQNWRLREVAGG